MSPPFLAANVQVEKLKNPPVLAAIREVTSPLEATTSGHCSCIAIVAVRVVAGKMKGTGERWDRRVPLAPF